MCSRIKQVNLCWIRASNVCTMWCFVCLSLSASLCEWGREAERGQGPGVRHCSRTLQNASGSNSRQLKDVLRLLLKIVLINQASADFISHHLCACVALNETKTRQTINYTKQHLRIDTHLDSLCVVRDVHARTPIMQMHTRALVEVRHTHTYLAYWLSSLLAIFSTGCMGKLKGYSLQSVPTKPLSSIYRLMRLNQGYFFLSSLLWLAAASELHTVIKNIPEMVELHVTNVYLWYKSVCTPLDNCKIK